MDYFSDKITLMCGYCLELMPDIPDGSVDMVLADPPYGTTQCKWDSIIPFEPMWKELKRIIKSNGAIVMMASQPYTSALVMSNPKMFKHEWIWIKNRGSNFANTVREPMKEHESVLVFSHGKWTYNKQMQKRTSQGKSRSIYPMKHRSDQTPPYAIQKDKGGKSDVYGKFKGVTIELSELRVPSSWQKINTVCGSEKTKHPTQKPVALMEYMIKTYTNEKDIVLDFAMGSGTTGVACKNLNRFFIGIEKDPEIFKTAKKRINELE